VRVSPDGSVTDLGSLDSVAKVKVDSTHPVIAQEEIHNATISMYFSVRRKILNIVVRSTSATFGFVHSCGSDPPDF